jgi:hypothetical protein
LEEHGHEVSMLPPFSPRTMVDYIEKHSFARMLDYPFWNHGMDHVTSKKWMNKDTIGSITIVYCFLNGLTLAQLQSAQARRDNLVDDFAGDIPSKK